MNIRTRRLRRVSLPALSVTVAALLSLASGCAQTQWWKDSSDSNHTLSPFVSTKSDPGQSVRGTGTQTNSSSNSSSLFGMNNNKANLPATEIAVAWRNYIDYLPDPTKEGKNGPGIAGQMFLFGPGGTPVSAEGTLTVDLYDETPRPAGQPGLVRQNYVFPKEVLKQLRTTDERFGKCFVVFLPWPEYRPDVTRVRITTRYDFDGRTLFGEELVTNISEKPSPMSWKDPPRPQGLQSLTGLGGLNGSSLGVGGVPTNDPNVFAPGGLPLGVIGSHASGAPAANVPRTLNLDQPIPVPNSANTNMTAPATTAPWPVAAPATPATPATPGPSMPSDSGLLPLGSAPQGLPPLAFTVPPPPGK
jgi:hypothetical protein